MAPVRYGFGADWWEPVRTNRAAKGLAALLGELGDVGVHRGLHGSAGIGQASMGGARPDFKHRSRCRRQKVRLYGN
jgi:hypothetical protein